MTLQEAIEARHSVRAYKEVPLTEDVVMVLNEKIKELNHEGQLHRHNLAVTLLAVYCYLQLGEMQMTKLPVIILTDMKVIIASMLLAIAGVILLRRNDTFQFVKK